MVQASEARAFCFCGCDRDKDVLTEAIACMPGSTRSLPPEIVLQILSRLSEKKLLQMKSISTEWRRTIVGHLYCILGAHSSSSSLSTSTEGRCVVLLKANTRKREMCLQSYILPCVRQRDVGRGKLKSELFCLQSISSGFEGNVVLMKFPLVYDWADSVMKQSRRYQTSTRFSGFCFDNIAGRALVCAGGLICWHSYEISHTQFHVLNPVTGAFRTLPPLTIQASVDSHNLAKMSHCGSGYYIIVQPTRQLRRLLFNADHCLQVYESRTNKWSDVQGDPAQSGRELSGSSEASLTELITCGDYFHVHEETDTLLAYNVEQGEWMRARVEVPEGLRGSFHVEVLVVAGHLVMVMAKRSGNQASLEVWELDAVRTNASGPTELQWVLAATTPVPLYVPRTWRFGCGSLDPSKWGLQSFQVVRDEVNEEGGCFIWGVACYVLHRPSECVLISTMVYDMRRRSWQQMHCPFSPQYNPYSSRISNYAYVRMAVGSFCPSCCAKV